MKRLSSTRLSNLVTYVSKKWSEQCGLCRIKISTKLGLGLEENPFAALMDFDQVKVEQRWLNPEQQEAHAKYVSAREDYIKNKDFDNYYREAKKPIDRRRWEYLMKRKAWFITPLGWNKIAETGGKVVDLGCGDGDVVQRLANFVMTGKVKA